MTHEEIDSPAPGGGAVNACASSGWHIQNPSYRLGQGGTCLLQSTHERSMRADGLVRKGRKYGYRRARPRTGVAECPERIVSPRGGTHPRCASRGGREIEADRSNRGRTQAEISAHTLRSIPAPGTRQGRSRRLTVGSENTMVTGTSLRDTQAIQPESVGGADAG